MLLFRSEEHLERWIESDNRPIGETLTVEQQWKLATRWFAGRDSLGWHKWTSSEAEEVFRSADLTSEFWSLS